MTGEENAVLTTHTQFPAGVPELRMPPLATEHRRARSRRAPGDTGQQGRRIQCVIFLDKHE